MQAKGTDLKLPTLTEILGKLSTNNDELTIQIDLINEKLNSFGRPSKKVEIKHEGGTSFIDTFQKEVQLFTDLVNELNKANGALGSLL